MQRHERHDPEPEKPDPKDTRVKWLLLAIAVGVTLHLVLLKTYRPEINSAVHPSTSEQS